MDFLRLTSYAPKTSKRKLSGEFALEHGKGDVSTDAGAKVLRCLHKAFPWERRDPAGFPPPRPLLQTETLFNRLLFNGNRDRTSAEK